MEASLLPTREYREFARRQTIATAKTDTADAEALRSEFALPNFNAWIVVLDAKGETLDQFCPDTDSECTEASKFLFPSKLVGRVERALREPLSVQELERRWRAKPHDAAAFEVLASRLDQMCQRRRLSTICTAALKQKELSPAARAMIELQAFLAEARDFVYENESGKDALTRQGEVLLVRHPDHALAPSVQVALSGLLKEGFDVPARWNASLARFEQAAKTPAQKSRLAAFKKERDEFLLAISAARSHPEIAANDQALLWYASLLGDAPTTVRILGKPEFKDNPQYAGILRQAKAKLALLK